ncbi:hypothetical protein WN943_010196 [Citrus x changshan-huyou]
MSSALRGLNRNVVGPSPVEKKDAPPARERIRVFKSGFVDGEEADDAERDEERDEDSDSDVPEVPDVYDMDTDLNSKEETHESLEANSCGAKTPLGNREADIKGIESPQGDLGNSGRGLSSKNSEDFDEIKGTRALTDYCEDAAGISNAATPDQTHTDINESHPGKPWERSEAANALMKQMWAEAQLDKRRIKGDYMLKMQYPSYMGNKAEPSLAISSADGRQSPLVTVDDKSNGTLVDLNLQQGQFGEPQKDQNCNTSMPPEGNQDYPVGPDNLVNQQSAYAAENSRMQLKSYIGQKAEETHVYRSLPLGQDRRRNRYWRFITSMSENDPGCGRIFVELCDGRWRLIDSEESFDALLTSLDVRGLRESHLHSVLQMIEMSFKETVRRNLQYVTTEVQNQETVKAEVIERASCPDYTGIDNPSSILCDSDSEISDTSTSFSIELGRDDVRRNGALKRYQDYERWMWKECVNSSILCAMEYGKKRCKQVLGFFQSRNSFCTTMGTKNEAAVGLRLMELDRSIAYLPHQRVEFQKEKREGNLMKLPSKYAAVKNTRDGEDQVKYLQVEEANRVDVGIGFAAPSHGRGIRGRARGFPNTGRSKKRVAGSRRDSGKRSTNTKSGRLVLVLKGQSHGQGSRKRGRRSARRYGEENGQATGDEYNDMIDEYAGGFNSRSNDLQEGSDDIVDGDEEDDEDEMGDGGAEDEQGYLDVEEYVNEESDEEGIRDGDGGQIGDPDEGTGASSSDLSD